MDLNSTGDEAATGTMTASHLRTEYLAEPLGLGIAAPRFSWTCVGGVRQTAYRIVALRGGETVWDSGQVSSASVAHIRYAGAPLRSRNRVEWSVQLWDEHGIPGPMTSSVFELGLLEQADWTATWITGDYRPKKNHRYPVDCFQRHFTTNGRVRSARLYITACGLYEARLNGRRVGEFQLAPGTTDYRRRLQYQTYDVTDLLAEDNALEVWLADGWYRGCVGAFGATNFFGRETKLLAQVEVTYDNGSTKTIVSDDGWTWSNDGPVRFADLKDGEVVDARFTPSYSGRARLARAAKLPTPSASDNVQPVAKEVFTATLLTTPSGKQVLDFGQNIAGFVAFTVTGEPGQQVRLRLGETLDDAGEFTQANFVLTRPVREFSKIDEVILMTGKTDKLRGKTRPTPEQEVVFTCSGHQDAYQTRFAVFGFRYALIETDVPFEAEDFHAIAVYSDLEPAGEFSCSNPEVNQFYSNTVWSMKGNFLDAPTDCPTRERLGWTGDAQVFLDTSACLMDVAPFFRKWLRDLADAQGKNGKVPAVVPVNGLPMMYDATGGSVGWQDALVLLPYRLWNRYGDESFIRDSYAMMRRCGMFMVKHTGPKKAGPAKANPYQQYVYEKGFHLGEWLEPEEFADDVRDRSLLRTEEATAYLHYTLGILAEVATVLGEDDDAALFAEYSEGAKQAYNHLFAGGGTIDTDRQAKLVRPLALGLLDGETRHNVEQRLVRAVENRGYRIGTGFLSTPFVLPVLTEAGRADVAYKMLENTEAPSWLAEVKAGATTVWEDWEGKASQNHYSPGAVCQWLFDTVLGIRVAGENHFTITPTPGGTLTHARGGYASLYGTVTSAWDRTPSGYRFTIAVPANTTADIALPGGETHVVGPGTHRYTVARPSADSESDETAQIPGGEQA